MLIFTDYKKKMADISKIFKRKVSLFLDSPKFSFLKEKISSIILPIIESRGTIALYDDEFHKRILHLINTIKEENTLMLNSVEACQVCKLVESVKNIPGDIAEVGVAFGSSAKLILEMEKNKTVHLFDTFEGLPEVDAIDSVRFSKGQFSSDYERVKTYLSKYTNFQMYKGKFPETAKPVSENKFSFINIDVDIYSSTRDSFNFFYPRMSRGGVMLSHDYLDIKGVRLAIDEFFSDKPEPIIQLGGTQCMIVKI